MHLSCPILIPIKAALHGCIYPCLGMKFTQQVTIERTFSGTTMCRQRNYLLLNFAKTFAKIVIWIIHQISCVYNKGCCVECLGLSTNLSDIFSKVRCLSWYLWIDTTLHTIVIFAYLCTVRKLFIRLYATLYIWKTRKRALTSFMIEEHNHTAELNRLSHVCKRRMQKCKGLLKGMFTLCTWT